jgi:hypothetical protein
VSLTDLVDVVASLEVAADDSDRIDQISLLEDLKRAACAAQARITDAFARSQRRAQIEAGVRSDRAHRGVADQVARARRDPPSRGDTHVGLARALVHEMPCTRDALAQGRIDEWTATGLVRETAVLSREQRTQVDAELDPVLRDEGRSAGELVRAAKGMAQRLDAAGSARRAAKAAADRRVSIRPAPDTMVWVGALLPVVDGVASYAALDLAASSAIAAGDPRGRGQLMADALVQRLTGRDPVTTPVDVRIDLVMTTGSLLGAADGAAADAGCTEPASVRARGMVPVPVPAPVARALVARAGAAGRAWVRRLFLTPDADRLVAMDSRSRRFPVALAELITLADQTCRTPWCDAPVRQADHVRPVRSGGGTCHDNGQGLCQRCNLVKEAPGWSARRQGDGTVRSTTPTGRTHVSSPPPVLGWPPTRADDVTVVDDLPPVVQVDFAEARWHRRAAGGAVAPGVGPPPGRRAG